MQLHSKVQEHPTGLPNLQSSPLWAPYETWIKRPQTLLTIFAPSLRLCEIWFNYYFFKLHFVLVMMKCQFLFHFYFSQIFCDFGENFTVVDTNGEQPISNMISSVSKVTQILHKEYKKWAARTLICWVGFQGVYCMIKFLPTTCRSSTFKDYWKSNLSNVELINKQ